MPVKLTSREYKIIAATLVIAALSLAVSLKYFARAFPEASIKIRVNRDDSAPIAQKFLAERGLQVQGYRHAAIFDYDDEAKVYLERTQGLERMERLVSGPIHLWRWEHRWFKPQQKEELRLAVNPEGEVVGFDHEIPEAAAGADLDPAAARAIAEGFLTSVMKRDLADLEFVEGETEKRPARTDHTFTWKQKSVDLGDGSLRLEVDIDGNQVGGYHEFVKIPEQWSRDYEKLRARNDTAQIVDEIFWILLSVAMLIVLVQRLRDRDVPGRLAISFGAIGFALYFLSQLNTFPLEQFGYPTTDPYASFITGYLVKNLLKAMGVGLLVFLLVAASEPMYREHFPGLLSLRRILTWQGLRSRSFFMANVVGLGLTFFFFAYQAVFYVAANKLGAWAPSDISFSNDLNTRIPWVAVLLGGFLPAVSEETQFRAFAIPFLHKYLRSWPLALVLAAFNWGFLHSAYPNQPFFIRGVEVGVGGIITGLIMLRFGILATMIWHYSVDALYTAFLLLRSPNHYFMISGALTGGIMLIPLIAALVAYWRNGTFTEEQALTNASEGIRRALAAEAAAEPEVAPAYQPLSSRRLMLAGILIAVFVVLAFVPVYRFGHGIKVRISREQAERAADEYLRQRKVPVDDYMRVAWLRQNVDPLPVRYILERRTVEQADEIYRQATRLLLWEVRYFRPLQKEEHHVFVDASSGQVFSHQRLLDENAPGASLPLEQARQLAEGALLDRGYQLSDFDLQESEAQKRKAREDYTFVWQAKAGDPRNVGDAHYRLEADIAGDQVVSISRFFKLPEDWLRQRTTNRLSKWILIGLEIAFFGGIAFGAVLLFIQRVRSGKMPWRPAIKVGALIAVVSLLTELNGFPTLYQNYRTEIPLAMYRVTIIAGYIVGPLLAGLAAWLAVAFAASLYPSGWLVVRRAARRLWRRDAAVAIALSLAAAAALSHMEMLVSGHFHAWMPVSIDLAGDSLDTYLPGPGSFLGAVFSGIFQVAAAGVVIYMVRQAWLRRAWWFWVEAALLLVALGPSGAHSLPEFVLEWAVEFVSLAVAVGLVCWFFRDNVLAYVGALLLLPMADPLIGLLSQPLGVYRWNGVVLGALAVALLAWMLLVPGSGEARSS